MIGLRDNELLIRCSCHDNDHMAFLIYEPDDSRGNNIKGENDDWYLSVLLSQRTFWKRLIHGLVYIFIPHRLRFGAYAELVLKNDDVRKIAAFISTHERSANSTLNPT